MPEAWTGNNSPETALNARCPEHGLIASGPRDAIDALVPAHFMDYHPEQTLIIQGRHFTIEIAPFRCDVCGVVPEPPYWTHHTNRPLLEYGDADGAWLVCDACHELILARDLHGLIAKTIAESIRDAPTLTSREIRAEVAKRHVDLLNHIDEGVRT